jgi:hypothetical protein
MTRNDKDDTDKMAHAKRVIYWGTRKIDEYFETNKDATTWDKLVCEYGQAIDEARTFIEDAYDAATMEM